VCSTVLQVISKIIYIRINSCNYLYRTAYAIEDDALTNIFLNLIKLRITREASSRIHVILLLYFFLNCSPF
jgi:hypothetical protein